jgi:uncharacterized membrane protein
MMKWVGPIITRFKLLPRPRLFSVSGHAPAAPDQPTTGQRAAEQVAAFVGSWWFLGGQAFFLFLWLVYNTLQFTTRFDPPPYILLNLLLSFQAAFTGPVLLIAANVGAIRDHKQADRTEQLAAQSARLSQQNEELAQQNEQLVERLLNIEQALEQHVSASLQAHTDELRDLGIVMRAVHAAVIAAPPNGGAAVATAPVGVTLAEVVPAAVPAAAMSVVVTASDDPPESPLQAPTASEKLRRRPASGTPAHRGKGRSGGT